MSTLFELTKEYEMLYQMATECAEDEEEIFMDTMEGIEGEIEEKAEGYACIISQLNGDVATLKAEIDRLSERKRAIEKNINNMKKNLETAMRTTGKIKFKTALHSFGIRKNPKSVIIDNEADIPECFLIPQPSKPDKKAIKAFLEGLDKNDTCKFAHLQQTEGLTIK